MSLININSTENKYNVIYADPPWSFNSKRTGGSMSSGSVQQYKSVMTIGELKALPVANLAADNCALVMWYVSSQPQEALDLVKAWGFTLRNMNGFVWDKRTCRGNSHFGMGFYTRAGAEMALIATKGKPSEIVKDHSVRQVQPATVGKHSEKPKEYYGLIEKLFHGDRRIELFARNTHAGWDCFGNEVAE